MATEIQAPQPYDEFKNKPSVFLAGSIEMDKAIPWQKEVIKSLKDVDVLILNPRRNDWDSSWKQSITDYNFKTQVNWELDGIEHADIMFLFLDPETKSPISLMELGVAAASHYETITVCPDGYWKKGNVEILCDRYDIPLLESLDQGIKRLKQVLKVMSIH